MKYIVFLLILCASQGYSQTYLDWLEPRSPISIYLGDNIHALGDSYTHGQAASNISLSFPNLLNTYINGTLTRYSAGGSGVQKMAAVANQSFTTATTGTIMTLAGLNDYRYGGATAKTDSKVTGAYNILLMQAFSKNIYTSTTAGWAQTGTWTPISLTSSGARTGTLNNTGDATLSLTASGKAFGFAFMGSDGTATYGSVRITVDGIEHHNFSLNNRSDGYNDGVYTGAVSPYGVVIFGLSAGSHNFVIEATGSNCPFNYMVELSDPAVDYVNNVLIGEPPKLPADGYLVPPTNGSDAVMEHGSDIIKAVADSYANKGYPVAFIPINDFLNVATDFDTDDLHPNDFGHNKIYLAFRSVLTVPASGIFPNRVNMAYRGNINPSFYIGRHASAWQAYAGGNLSLATSTNGYVEVTIPSTSSETQGWIIGFNTTQEVATYTSYEYGMSYNAVPAVYRLTNGAGYTSVQAGLLPAGSKLRLERQSTNTIKIRYASDGVNFSDIYTFPGTSTAQFYLNLTFDALNKKVYNITTNGFN
jgi:hypothetical protein